MSATQQAHNRFKSMPTDQVVTVEAGLLVALYDAIDMLAFELSEAMAEKGMLQDILDSRPAINSGLPASYIRWTKAIYSGDIARATLRHPPEQQPPQEPA